VSLPLCICCTFSHAWAAAASAASAVSTASAVDSSVAYRATDRGDSGNQIRTDTATSTRAGDAMEPDANGMCVITAPTGISIVRNYPSVATVSTLPHFCDSENSQLGKAN